ncbi:MAG: MFS transporter [Chloroflexi bacterium]|nr:MFS transporter [Chloroflexota bacterium]
MFPRVAPRWRIFALCWVTYAAFYLGRVNLAVAMPAIQTHFGWSKGTVGLIGSTLYWSYAIGQLVNGALGDRASARAFVGLGMLLSALLNLLFGSLGALGAMALVWGLNGWVQSMGWGPLVKTLSRWFSAEKRGLLSALFAPCYVAGHAVSWLLAGRLVSAWGWRAAFWVPGALLLGGAIFWALNARDDPTLPRGKLTLWGQGPSPLRLGSVFRALGTPGLRWGLIVGFFSGMVKDALSLWAPTYLLEVQGLPLGVAAGWAAAIPFAGGAGAFLSGLVLHRSSHQREAPIVVGAASLVAAGAMGLLLLNGRTSPLGALAALTLSALGSHGMNALLMTSLPLRLGGEGNVSSAAGALDFISYVGGGLSGALTGYLLDGFGWPAVFGLWLIATFAILLSSSRRIFHILDKTT